MFSFLTNGNILFYLFLSVSVSDYADSFKHTHSLEAPSKLFFFAANLSIMSGSLTVYEIMEHLRPKWGIK